MKSQATSHLTRRADFFIGLLLFLGGLYAYVSTLAPTVLEGDAALFQYTPYVLGVTYPTGYPLYILLGKLWVTLLPVGEIAWRMNLLSALCSALALPIFYGAFRRLYASGAANGPARWAAMSGVLIFATLPTFWRWSTEAKIYALNLLLFGGVLYTLLKATTGPAKALTPASQSMLSPWAAIRYRLARWQQRWPLAGPVLLLGLQLSVHSTTVLLVPGLLLFAWLHLRPQLFTPKRFLAYTGLLALPGLLYLYVPLRAEWLIAQYGRLDAIGRGLLADFYHSGLAGLVRYFSAADFTGGVVSNWGLVPQQFGSVYLPLLLEEFSMAGAVLGLLGGLAFAIRQPRRFVPLFLIYLLPIPFVLTYGQGEQSAFLLPSFLALACFAGYAVLVAGRLLEWLVRRLVRPASAARWPAMLVPPLLVLALFPLFLVDQIQHNTLWLSRKWTRAIYHEWADALSHPLEPGAGMLAHWGDLTSFWYMQHAEQRRPDLRGVYPPNEANVIDWFERGNEALYIAGPLQGWAAGIDMRYQLLPWGRLVRIAPRRLEPQQLLPALAQPIDLPFGDKLRLIGAGFAPEAMAGQLYPVVLTWQTLAALDSSPIVSLRLSRDDIIVTQLDDPLRSGWFPQETLPEGQHLLSYPLLPVPVGILPGEYRFQLVVYQDARQPWPLPDGTVVLDMGPVTVVPPPPDYRPDLTPYKTPASHDFNGEIVLLGYDYSVARVGQGKGFAIDLLWQARQQPVDNYSLLIEQLDGSGRVLRSQTVQPLGGRAPTSGWQAGQFIRDVADVVVPASAPPGEAALGLRLSWLRPDGSQLAVRRWGIPLADSLELEPLRVTEKENRTFEAPRLAHILGVNLGNKAKLLGYNRVSPAEDGQTEQAGCRTSEVERCRLALDLYWQGLAEMAEAYRVFVHVVDAEGQIITQHDRAPGRRGKEPTTGWLPGEVIHDPIDLPLPADIEPGLYAVQVGLYLPPAGPRLPVVETDEPVPVDNNTVIIDTVEISEP